MKLKKSLGVVVLLSVSMSMTAYAGTWKTGEGNNQSKWWYDNENGSYANNGWYWIDGNNDGTAERYYFDNDGWLLANTTTPDGYSVNENGAWVNNGVVETQIASLQNGGEEKQSTIDYCGWYKTLEEEDGYSDFSRIKISQFSEDSVTLSEFFDTTRTYNKGADNKYYSVDGNGYFQYVYFDGDILVCCYEGWIQHFVKE